MKTHRGKGRQNPVAVATPTRGPLSRPCPECGAKKWEKCVVLKSWVEPENGRDGFFAKTLKGFHAPRRSPALAQRRADAGDRTAMRSELRSLAMRKLPAGQRVNLWRWLASPHRTDKEIAYKLAELRGMEDLPW